MKTFLFPRKSGAKGKTVRPRISLGGLSLACLVLVFLIGLANLSPAQTATNFSFSDGSFTNWTSTGFDGYPQQSVTVQTSGGDPGAFLQVETTSSSTQNTELYNPDFTYNPALGAISNISYSEDIDEIYTFGEGMACAFLVVQNGVGFYGDYHDTDGTDTGWTYRSTTGLVAASFSSTAGQHPNFSTTGSPVTFGLWTKNSGGDEITVGFDNYDITIEVGLLQPLLTAQKSGTNIVLTWSNPAYTLQAAPTLGGTFTNVTGAASPCTNAITGAQLYFRLQAPLN